ncbi:hypothetical protein [Nostoc sp.]|uniref:hypothetical protein n=1 Tax=Nostoc sp. TaxID=1180 RepID=UPI002FF44C8F
MYSNRGLTFIKMVNYKIAIQDFEQAILLDSGIPSAYYGKGLIYFYTELFLQAIENFNLAIKLYPKYIEAAP